MPPASWLDDQRLGSAMGAWDATRAGCALDYATADTFAQRMAAMHRERERRQAEAEGAFVKEYRRARGVGAA